MARIVEAEYPVSGMMCTVCAGSVQKVASETPGVVEANVNFATESIRLRYDAERTSPESIAAAIEAAGYTMIVADSARRAAEEQERQQTTIFRRMLRETIIAWVISIPMCIACTIHYHFPGEGWAMCVGALIVMLLCGHRFYTVGFRNLLKGRASMESLVALSTSVSFLFSLAVELTSGAFGGVQYFEASAMIIAFVLTGKLLEQRARRGTGAAIRALMTLSPEIALKVTPEGTTEKVATSTLRPADRVRILPGERIPVDGSVVDGFGEVDESMLTGEPLTVNKPVGSSVSAGTLNAGGSAFDIVTEKSGDSTVLAHIIESVRLAQGSKAPVQQMVDRIAAIFVPVVMSLALLAAAIWILIGSEGYLSRAILAGVSVLVIACPCALGLATPTAVMVGIGRAARAGILVKDAAVLEALAKVKCVVFDKTGTLTEGSPAVTGYEQFGNPAPGLLSAVAEAETLNTHPLAEAIVAFARANSDQDKAVEVTGVEYVAGRGLFATYQGRALHIGSLASMRSEGIAVPSAVEKRAGEATAQGESVVAVSYAGEICYLLRIADQLRPEATKVIKTLQEEGIRTVLLSGDAPAAVEYIGRELGIEEAIGGVTPFEKADKIRALHEKYGVVGMVGDGINDATALAEADISIAMGTGSDVAIETASVTLAAGHLDDIPKAVGIARATVRIIRENLFWAFIYNVIGIPIAAGALYPLTGEMLSPAMASAAMALSSVSVVLNSLRLNKLRIK